MNQDFLNIIKQQLGADYEAFVEALNQPPTVSVRINNKVAASMIDVLDGSVPVPYCTAGFTLPSRPDFTLDPLLHAGAYYVQEASSMYLEAIINRYVTGNVTVLDLCAAPGGKSTHLASLLSDGSLLVSNEIMPQRANVLAENLTKWGNVNTIVTNNKPSDFARAGSLFDLMVTDVPCSGEGMFRKEPKAVEDWSLEAVDMCACRQRSILSDVWDALKEGGLLIYSTCTFNSKEDEDNVEWIAAELGAEVLEQKHFYFHDAIGEGFFIAALRKTSAGGGRPKIKPCHSEKTPQCANLIQNGYTYIKVGDEITAVPEWQADLYAWFANNFRTLKCGIPLCTFKGKDEVPCHGLALSKALNLSAAPHAEVDLGTALNYLRREAITLQDAPKGYVALTYKGAPLGWVKNLGSRANNLYPEYWRIRKNC